MSSSTVFLPLERSRYFRHGDGFATTKAEADEVELRVDWSDELASGETVSSVSYADSGVTTSSKSVSGNVSIATVTGIGYTTLTATLSSGRTRERRFYYFDTDGARPRDYR